MVSKDKYYELKSKGLCVKCSGPREESSPSEVRCLSCHQRFLGAKKEREKDRVSASVCIQCGTPGLVGISRYCNECREKNANYKKKLTAVPLSVYKEGNENCKLCNGIIDTVGTICQKCLDLVQFSRLDALMRYGNQCFKCYSTNVEELVIASSDITATMKHSGPELYKHICFSVTAPKAYTAVCSTCYWQSNIEYLTGVRQTLLSNKPTDSDASILVEEILGEATEMEDPQQIVENLEDLVLESDEDEGLDDD